MLAAALSSGDLDLDGLPQLLTASEWGASLQPSCVEEGVRVLLPEPALRMDGSAPTGADFQATLRGAPALNSTSLLGPQQSGSTTVYTLSLSLVTPRQPPWGLGPPTSCRWPIPSARVRSRVPPPRALACGDSWRRGDR